MERITTANLENLVRYLNKITGNKEVAHEKGEDGKYHYNIGSYILNGAYGGYQLSQIVNENGGERSIIGGYLPKRELYDRIHAYKDGILDTKV